MNHFAGIDESIVLSAAALRREWNEKTEDSPALQLDLGWASIGILDNMLKPFRGTSNFSEDQLSLFHSISCYLSIITKSIWESFDKSPEVTVTLDSETGDVVTTMKGGNLLKKDEIYSVPVNKILLSIIEEDETITSLIDFSKKYDPLESILSPVSFALFAGLSPYGRGSLARMPVLEAGTNVIICEDYLAATSAQYSRGVAPDDKIGLDPDSYTSKLIFPLMGMKEKFPASQATVRFCEYAIEKEFSNEELLRFAYNIVLSPDELISAVGFVLGVALSDGTPHPHLIAKAEARPQLALELRGAITYARVLFQKPSNWIDLAIDDKIDDAINLIEIERIYKVIPLFWPTAAFVKNRSYLEMLHSVAWSSHTGTIASFEKLKTEKKALSKEFYIFEAFINVRISLIDNAIDSLRKADEIGTSETNKGGRNSTDYQSLYIKGLCALANDEKQIAVETLAESYNNLPNDYYHSLMITKAYGSALLKIGNLEQALVITDQTLEKLGHSTDLLLHKLQIYDLLHEDKSYQTLLNELKKYATIDLRIFEILIY